MQLTGAQALIKSLEMEGVEVMFGLPGGCILPAYDPILDSSIRHILVRHEQGAGHMAEGYAHVTGRPGVAMVTSGPAATNLVTPLCDAYMDSIPMVAITGQVPTAAIGTDAFQECDTVGITRSVTKHNELVMDAADIPRAIREAFHIATTGRPGPVLVDVPKDVLQATMDWWWPESVDLPGIQADDEGPSPDDPRGGTADPGVRAARDLRGRRHLEGAGRRCASRARRAHEHPRGHDADGTGRVSRRPSAVPRHARHARQRHRGHRDAEGGPADRARLSFRRPGHGQGRVLRPRGQGHPRRHRSGRAGQGAPSRRADRRRLPPRDRGARQPDQGAARRRHGGRGHLGAGAAGSAAGARTSRSPTRRPSRATRSSRSSASSGCATPPPRTASWCRASVSTRCGRRSTGSSAIPTRG